MLQLSYVAAMLVLGWACGHSEPEDSCAAAEPWEAALEDWATAERGNVTRHGRIMSLPPSQGYYVTDRIDLVPPPPPRQHLHPPPSQLHKRGPYPMPGHASHAHHAGPPPGAQSSAPGNFGHSQPGLQSGSPTGNSYNHGPGNGNPSQQLSGSSYQPSGPQSHGPSQGPAGQAPGAMPYDEWQATPPPPPGAGKIVNRPPNPYKDQFKPSYPGPPAPPSPAASVDRVDSAPPAPHKQVSETDLYLLRAIEKLVYRVDLMEKRMRKMEENMHYVVAGAEPKPEPCIVNFTRIGSQCYHFSSEALNWKSASYACRKLKANLLELDAAERRHFVIGVHENKKLNGADYWTGGLNPGLLWIWSHSATPVAANGTAADGGASASIVGEGRCLALVASPATADYVYRGQDCALRHRYVCEKEEDKEKLGNEIERVAKSLRERKPKIAWD